MDEITLGSPMMLYAIIGISNAKIEIANAVTDFLQNAETKYVHRLTDIIVINPHANRTICNSNKFRFGY